MDKVSSMINGNVIMSLDDNIGKIIFMIKVCGLVVNLIIFNGMNLNVLGII